MTKIYATLGTAVLCLFFSSVFAQLTNETMQVGSVSRSFKQYLPVNLDPQNESPSLLFILHGIGGTSNDMVGAGFNNIADTARVIAVYPQGIPNGWGQNSWNNGTLIASTADDIGFFNRLIDSMVVNYNADPARVYFSGFSMGSIMTYHMACALNSRIAAVGCMAGTMPTSDIQSCVPAYATPVIHLHGTADGTVPYASGALPSLSLVPETIDFWRNVHGCNVTADSLRLPDTASDNITVDRFRYDNCNPQGSLELWRFNGADHVYLYQPVNDITEMIEVWLFLRRWQHPSPAVVGMAGQQLQFKIAPNPSNGVFTIETVAAVPFTVRNTDGKIVRSGTFHSGENSLELSQQPAGVYFLQTASTTRKLIKW